VPGIEVAVSHILDVVKHLVGTHVHWNIDLSKDEAVVKLEAARIALLAEDVAEVGHDIGNGDYVKTIADLEKALADAKAADAPVTPAPVAPVDMVKPNE
jgi:hypothetical protein